MHGLRGKATLVLSVIITVVDIAPFQGNLLRSAPSPVKQYGLKQSGPLASDAVQPGTIPFPRTRRREDAALSDDSPLVGDQ